MNSVFGSMNGFIHLLRSHYQTRGKVQFLNGIENGRLHSWLFLLCYDWPGRNSTEKFVEFHQ